MTNRHPNVWVMITDGERARVFVPVGSDEQCATTLAFDPAVAHIRSGELGTEHSGLSFESAIPIRRAIDEPRQDPQGMPEVAKWINAHAEAGTLEHLVLVVPGRALHDLREALGATASAKVIGSLLTESTRTLDDDVAFHLAKRWLQPTRHRCMMESRTPVEAAVVKHGRPARLAV